MTKKDLAELLDEKLQPIKDELSDVKDDIASVKDDVASVKDDVASVKDVIEKRVYKEMKEGFAHVNKRIDRLEEISLAIIEDSNDQESRIRHLEKRIRTPSNNN
ncbi:hypothetical protein HY468_04785 [Candidatus Roizmanbacteria bacterium]|nr:hypothetical protein [Candidatus Roizmanbacteria bacterium]